MTPTTLDDPLLSELNAAQRRAVTHGSGPLWISAIPGSGKTRVIVARCAWLIRRGARPEQILALTFSRRAARELTERLTAALGPAARRLWSGTLHSFAAWLLRAHARLVGRTPAFAIWDDADQLRAIRGLARDLDLASEPSELAHALEVAKRGGRPPHATPQLAADVARLLPAYADTLRAHDAFDFSDLIIQAVGLLSRHEVVRRALRRRFPHLVVDEAQDLDLWQHRLVELLAGATAQPPVPVPPPEPGAATEATAPACAPDDDEGVEVGSHTLLLAADPSQAIYRFRGSAPERLLAFERLYPNSSVVDISHNYRSTPEILGAAARLIAHNRTRRDTTFHTDNPSGPPPEVWHFPSDQAEAAAVAERLQAWVAAGERPVAVLARIGALLGPVARACQRQGLAVRVVDELALTARKEIRDLLAYLRAACHPQDWAAHERALGVPPRGIGPVRLGQLRAAALAQGARAALDAAAPRLAGVRDYLEALDEVRARLASPAAALRALVKRLDYQAYLATRVDPDGSGRRWEHVEALLDLADAWQHRTGGDTSAWLDELILEADAPEDAPADVECMTIHRSKGTEFPAVVVLGLEEGILPSAYCQDDDDVEEERRLCYVAMTRARRRLALTCTWERRLWGLPRRLAPSRFLAEAALRGM